MSLAYWVCDNTSFLAHTLNVSEDKYSKSEIMNATKYVDIGTVSSNVSHSYVDKGSGLHGERFSNCILKSTCSIRYTRIINLQFRRIVYGLQTGIGYGSHVSGSRNGYGEFSLQRGFIETRKRFSRVSRLKLCGSNPSTNTKHQAIRNIMNVARVTNIRRVSIESYLVVFPTV